MENQNAAISPDAWAQTAAQGTSVTTEFLDKKGTEYQKLYEAYEAKKKEASKLLEEAEKLESELIEAMDQAGKTKYYVEGLGTFYFSDKLSVKTPKTIAEKKALFGYIQQKHGETVLFDKIGINSQTLQGFYKSEYEEFNERSKSALEEGKEFTDVFAIPGLDEPTNMRSLNFKKEKK